MITLFILGIILLTILFVLVSVAGGILVVILDPLIAVLIIFSIIKIVNWIKNR